MGMGYHRSVNWANSPFEWEDFHYLNCCLVGFLENFPKSRLAEAKCPDSKTMPRWILMRRYLPMLFHSSYFCSHYVSIRIITQMLRNTSLISFFSSSKFFKIFLLQLLS